MKTCTPAKVRKVESQGSMEEEEDKRILQFVGDHSGISYGQQLEKAAGESGPPVGGSHKPVSNLVNVDWRSLPSELVEIIARKLTILADYNRFRAVCRSWRSFTLRIPNHLPFQFPWLMLAQNVTIPQSCVSVGVRVGGSLVEADVGGSLVVGDNQFHPLNLLTKNINRRSFFDIVNNKIYHLDLPEVSHHQYSRRFCGSSHGWLAIIEESLSIFLFNPLIREKIHLPPLSSFPGVVSFDPSMAGKEYLIRRLASGAIYYRSAIEMRDSFIKKILLSGTPASSFVAIALITPRNVLAYCKSGETCWKYIKQTMLFSEDVTYLNGLFYSVNKSGEIALCDLNGDSPVVEFIHTPELMFVPDIQYHYLVNLMGELLLVTRFLELSEDFPYGTSDFRLFKLDFAKQKWEEMRSLGDMVLFLGNLSSLALKASDFPGCTGNKIYFLDDHFDVYYDKEHGDVGVFNLDDRSFDKLPCSPIIPNSQHLYPFPVWITPNPC